MASPAQIHANRINAKSSTGPKSESGKSTSSRNATTLGLFTRQPYVDPAEGDLFRDFAAGMHAELTPSGSSEETLTEQITDASWRLRHCDIAELELTGFDEATDKIRRSIERARSTASRILHRSIDQLRKLQTERLIRRALSAFDLQNGQALSHQAPNRSGHVLVSGFDLQNGQALSPHAPNRSGNILVGGFDLQNGQALSPRHRIEAATPRSLGSSCNTAPPDPDKRPITIDPVASFCKTAPPEPPIPRHNPKASLVTGFDLQNGQALSPQPSNQIGNLLVHDFDLQNGQALSPHTPNRSDNVLVSGFDLQNAVMLQNG